MFCTFKTTTLKSRIFKQTCLHWPKWLISDWYQVWMVFCHSLPNISLRLNNAISYHVFTGFMELLKVNRSQKIRFSILTTVQDRKTNSFVCFLGESAALQFCFEIFWPLEKSANKYIFMGLFLSVCFPAVNDL